jgi:hypothetical protein
VSSTLKYLTGLRKAAAILLLPVATGIASIVITANDESIARPTAAAFLIRYWEEAPRHPELTWELLTPDWRERSTKDSADPYGSYRAFLSSFSRIDATNIRLTDRQNYFEVSLTFIPKKPGAKPVTEHLTYGLRCEWWDGHMPLFECDQDELTIFDGYETDGPTAP